MNARTCPDCDVPARWDELAGEWECRRCGHRWEEPHTPLPALSRAREAIARAQEKADDREAAAKARTPVTEHDMEDP